MACSFDNQETTADLEIQIKDYIVDFVTDSSVAVQTNQVTAFMSPTDALYFEQNRCSDIEEIILDQPLGNRQLYQYEDIEIWIYTVRDLL